MLYRYQVYGLTLESELECPELALAPPDAAVDVRIRLSRLSPTLESPSWENQFTQVAPGIFQRWVTGVARYRVEEGRRIWVDPIPGANPGDIRAYLLGIMLGVTTLLRGLLPLHASAVSVNGGAYAFCGESGAGKSTLVAALYRRGCPLLTDDMTVVKAEQANATVFPGVQRIKLWRDALGHFAMNPNELTRDLTRADKYHWSIDEGYHANPLPLRRIYALAWSSGNESRIERLRGSAALALLCEHSFGSIWMNLLNVASPHLALCSSVLASTEVFRFSRPVQLDDLETSQAVLLEHISRPIGHSVYC